MTKSEQIRAKVAKTFRKLRLKFFPENPLVKLIKISEAADQYDDVLELDNWFFEYSDFRQNYKLEIADDFDELTTAIATATHIDVDGDIYVITKADTKAPQGTDITWNLFATKFFNRGQVRNIY